MIFKDADHVKKWFRNLPLIKKELDMKINFYNSLINDYSRVERSDNEAAAMRPELGTYFSGLSNVEFYRSQIESAKKRYDRLLGDWERLSELLDSDEKRIITTKYLKGTSWDAMEFLVFFSRRQCFRIVDRAAQKLVGETAGE